MKLFKIFAIGLLLFFVSCSTQKGVSKSREHKPVQRNNTATSSTHQSENKKVTTAANIGSSVEKLLKEAKKYLGTPYQYAGTTKSGMDCSGLVISSFQALEMQLPRRSSDQANEGEEIRIIDAQPGDLIFFNTSGGGISHVGIVERIEGDEIFFIHSSSSKGVIISSLENAYWKPRFVKITRIL